MHVISRPWGFILFALRAAACGHMVAVSSGKAGYVVKNIDNPIVLQLWASFLVVPSFLAPRRAMWGALDFKYLTPSANDPSDTARLDRSSAGSLGICRMWVNVWKLLSYAIRRLGKNVRWNLDWHLQTLTGQGIRGESGTQTGLEWSSDVDYGLGKLF
ncbi:hypothetical protein EDD17DRAFT_1505630 [Pisolithus thermaeus]|nr:hypothetical protein EDD17DRAFT_1505630 [Pisolithus thermaeus]